MAAFAAPTATYTQIQHPISCPVNNDDSDDDHNDDSTLAAVLSDKPTEVYAAFDTLRSHCPVARTGHLNGFWLLTRYDDIKAAAMDSNIYISSVCSVVPSDPRGLRRPPLNFDAPEHTPYRTALDRTLKPSRLKRLERVIERHAEVELAPLLRSGAGDICTTFGAQFSALVETSWLNLEEGLAPVLATTAAAWVNTWRLMDAERVNEFSSKLYQMAKNLLEDRRRTPRDPDEDPASSLLLERDRDGRELDEEHLVGAICQSLVVGMIAPPIMLGNICDHLSKYKELQKRLRDQPELIPAAVEEFVRLYTPYRGFTRTTSRDVEIHGKTIHPAEPITMTYASANRDPTVFKDPAEFVMHRENIAMHLGFGKGRHRCVGMPLARMMLIVALRTLLLHTNDFEVNGPLEYARLPEMGIISCPLRLVQT